MRRFTGWMLVLILFVVSPGGALAAPPAATFQGPTDAAELESFLDPIFARHMQELNIPGAAFVLVKDGRIFFAKGYGLADVEKGAPVVPDRTIFAVGSVTKLFTATAVMQLAEQGKLDLHADINKYLGELQVPANYPEPVTAAHLLTHTAGFGQPLISQAARTEAELMPLGQYLARAMPRRLRPPGQEWEYSNYGFGLAGYLVETISGRSYEQYITDEILRPLGMTHSAFGRPASMAADLAPVRGYTGNPPVRQIDWQLNMAPAGDLKATATDMAAFMIAHLQNGEYQGERILREETAREMHSVQLPASGRAAPDMDYGFWEEVQPDGRRVLGHGGDVGSSSFLVLVPDENWGFFVVYNSPAGSECRQELGAALVDHYPPGPPKSPVSPDAPNADAARYVGTYRLGTYDQNAIAKVQGLLATIAVVDNGDGSLSVRSPGNHSLPTNFVPVEPLVLRSADGRESVHFQADARGRITRLSIPFAVFAARRLAWYEHPALHLGLITAVVLLALSALILWPVVAWLRRRRDRSSLPVPVGMARRLGGVVSGLYLICLVGLGLFLASVSQSAAPGVPVWVKLLMTLPLLAVALTVPLVWMAVRVWRIPGCSLMAKLHMALLTLAFVLFVPCLQYWNLLGIRP